MICVFYYMTGTAEGSTKSRFMEKPGIEPVTPGLQGIALIHYTTGASQNIYGFPFKHVSPLCIVGNFFLDFLLFADFYTLPL